MKNQGHRVLLSVSLVLLTHLSFAQCAPAPPAVATCSGGNGAATNGQNINGGQTYWFSGGPTTFAAGVNLNGGTLRVCGNLTLSSINFNSGRIIIESGGSLTINATGDLYLNAGCTITNRGSFTFNNFGIHMQGANSRIWNVATTAVMNIAGTLEFNNASAKLINQGIVNAHDFLIQSNALAGAVCLEDGAIVKLTSLVNNLTGAFAYSGTGATPACVSVSTSAQRNNNVASSTLIDICAGTGITYTGGAGWGTATVTNNCSSSCFTLLPQELLSFTATAQTGQNRLQWITADNSPASAVFYIEASADGSDFHTIGTIQGAAGKSVYSFYDAEQTNTTQYYRIQQVMPGGRSGYSAIISVRGGAMPALQVFPSPAHTGSPVTFIVNAPASGTARISLVDVNGKTVMQKSIVLNAGSNRFNWNLAPAGAGIFIAKIEGAASAVLYSRALVIVK